MTALRRMFRIGRAWTGGVIVSVLVMPPLAHAERPPLRAYTAADGLAHDRVTSILADSHGFLWFSTANGLSRFDGSRFITYGPDDGLSTSTIATMVELDGGDYLVGSNGGGVGWYRPGRDAGGGARFRMFMVNEQDAAANRVNVLYRGRDRIWAGTDAGLYELVIDDKTLRFTRAPLATSARGDARVHVLSLVEDAQGRLWIGSSLGLSRLTPDGQVVHEAIHPVHGADPVRALLLDSDGRVWAGHDAGLFLITDTSTRPGDRRSSPETLGTRRRYTVRDGLSHDRVYALHRTSDGTIWIGTLVGLTKLQGTSFSSAGLSTLPVRALAADRYGHLWIAIIAGGVVRLAAHGLTSYTTDDGLASPYVQHFIETRDGRLGVVTREQALSLFDGTRFKIVRPRLPPGLTAVGRTRHNAFFEDGKGEWWVPSGDGLFRFSGTRDAGDLAWLRPSAFYTTRDGLAGIDIWRLFEDGHGDIWVATRAPGNDPLTRWERATGRFLRYSDSDGLPAHNPVAAFAEDKAGQIWVGFWDGGAARLRSGRFEMLPAFRHPIVAWHVARNGVLWGASLGGGLIRIDKPDAPLLEFRTVGTREGLPTDRLAAIAEDDRGRLYLGSPLGITRIDLNDGSIRQYTQEDGLARTEVNSAFRDRFGTLWFGTDAGVSRLVPEDSTPAPPIRLLIGGARVNGIPLPVSDLGTPSAGPFVLDAEQRHVEIDFMPLGVSQASGIQYRLEGAENDWTPAAGRRTVNYARLASGSYRFAVRALDGRGWTEASLTFTIRPPLWQRGWFFLSMCGLVGVGLFVAHRTRVARLVAVERVRTHIASDLHDDIGTNLSQIAILGELLKRRAGGDQAGASLARIADLSRESVDSLGDIVWSIDPDKESLGQPRDAHAQAGERRPVAARRRLHLRGARRARPRDLRRRSAQRLPGLQRDAEQCRPPRRRPFGPHRGSHRARTTRLHGSRRRPRIRRDARRRPRSVQPAPARGASGRVRVDRIDARCRNHC